MYHDEKHDYFVYWLSKHPQKKEGQPLKMEVNWNSIGVQMKTGVRFSLNKSLYMHITG